MLFRALRGSSGLGLAGMPPVAEAADALILRPLLPVPRARLLATCAARGVEPLRDPSNADPRFARARLRREVPSPADALPAAAAHASRRARREREAAARLARAARLFPEGCARLDPAALGADAAAALALRRLVRAVGGARFAPSAAAARALLERGSGSLGGAVLASGAGGARWLLRETAALAPPVEAKPGATWDGRFRLRGAVPPGLTLGPLGPVGPLGPLGPVPRGLRALAPDLPAAALAALPALRDAVTGALALVPALRWPSESACASLWCDYLPRSGPGFPGEMAAMPVSAPDMAPYLCREPASPRHEDRET